ncbi:MAG: hypothetical protein ACI92Z_000179, partial [Paracoccaceae bacterium]
PRHLATAQSVSSALSPVKPARNFSRICINRA